MLKVFPQAISLDPPNGPRQNILSLSSVGLRQKLRHRETLSNLFKATRPGRGKSGFKPGHTDPSSPKLASLEERRAH